MKYSKDDSSLIGKIISGLIEDGIESSEVETLLESGKFNEILQETMGAVWPKYISEYLFDKFDENLSNIHNEKQEFETKNYEIWKKPFQLLETLICITQEIGHEFNHDVRPEAAKSNDLIFEALIRLHGRGAQVALEILHLMEGGYPNGALARWRTLYEIAVVSSFIRDHDQETANRFLLHERIHNYKANAVYLNDTDKYERHQKLTGNLLPTESEIEYFKSEKEKLCEKFGKDFDTDCGWAKNLITSPNMKTLAEEVGLDHYYPYTKMANIPVHSGSKGINFSLGVDIENFIHCGPSYLGMADPGQLAACSLFHINVALLMSKPSIERIVTCHVLEIILDKTNKSFIDVHNSLDSDEKLDDFDPI